ncbi:MAG: hypothetical protein ACI89X_002578 [Planctomycetota bacterium]
MTSGSYGLKLLLFTASLSLASLATWFGGSEVKQALIWLPSGVAVAGLAMIGWPAVWVVAITIAVQRQMIGRGLQPSCVAAAAASLEALFGAWLVHAFQIRRGLDRLRDVMTLYLVTLCAPLASITFTLAAHTLWLGRSWDSSIAGMTG